MKDKKQKIVITILVILIIIVIAILLTNILTERGISKVQKVLNEKYDSIKCIDANCDGIMAVQNKNDKTSKVRLYNGNGKLIAKYEQKESKKVKTPYVLKKNYFLTKISENEEVVEYTINNTKGKKVYSTSNKLIAVNDNFIMMSEEGKIGDVYTLIDKDGKEKYSNISDYYIILNGEYIYFENSKDCYILDKKGEKVLENYKISEIVKDSENNDLYLVLKDKSNNVNYYYDIEKEKLVGDGFDSYVVNEDNTLTVIKKESSKNISYDIDKNGKKSKEETTNDLSDTIKSIKEKINSEEYYLYTLSIVADDQNKVLVDNKKDKSFGMLNIKTNKYTKIYSYNSDNFYSTISELDSTDDHVYIQTSCNSNICGNTQMVVYDLTDSKELFKLEGTSLVASDYIQYTNGYKTVKYSNQSENADYKGKYALYDGNNKELVVSENQIVVIDSKYVMGEVNNESLVLYLAKENKKMNDDSSLAEKLEISDKEYYKYKGSNKMIIVDSNGKEMYSVKNGGNLKHNNQIIYSISNNTIRMYDVESDAVNTYKLSKNESLTDSTNNSIDPFENVIFINNGEENYIKIIDEKGKVVRKIKEAQIMNVLTDEDDEKAYIITQKKVNKEIKYGLYIAK